MSRHRVIGVERTGLSSAEIFPCDKPSLDFTVVLIDVLE